MPPKSLSTENKKMFELMHFVINSDKYKSIKSKKDFCEAVGFSHSNLPKVENGILSFSIENLKQAAKLTGSSMDWICGLVTERIAVKRTNTSITDLLEEALRKLKAQKRGS